MKELTGSKWIPLWGMFTRDIDSISDTIDNESLNLAFAGYHGISAFLVILGIVAIVDKFI